MLYQEKYKGGYLNGMYHGKGKLEGRKLSYEEEDGVYYVYFEYEGDFKAGKFHGKGRLEESWATTEEDEKEFGAEFYERYEGEFIRGLLNGKGTHTSTNANPQDFSYEGDFEFGKYHGTGKFTCDDLNEGEWGEYIYEGGYRNGLHHGNGALYLPNGDIYKGEFKYHKYHGSGELKKWNGSILNGKFHCGRCSNGILTFPNIGQIGERITVGENNQLIYHSGVAQLDGNGFYDNYVEFSTHIDTDDNNILECRSGLRYIYEFIFKDHEGKKSLTGVEFKVINNQIEKGYSKYTWENGDIYEGEFVDYKCHGYGELTRVNGDRYEGKWVDDAANGYGELTWADGDRYEGEWVDDKMKGKGVFTYVNGDKIEGEFANGEYLGKEPQVVQRPDEKESEDDVKSKETYKCRNCEKEINADEYLDQRYMGTCYDCILEWEKETGMNAYEPPKQETSKPNTKTKEPDLLGCMIVIVIVLGIMFILKILGLSWIL